MYASVCVCGLPGHVDSHILVCGSGQDAEQLVENGGQKVHHHMTLHRMETLGEKGGSKERKEGINIEHKFWITRLYSMGHEQNGVLHFLQDAQNTFRYLTSSPSEACSDISML